MRTNFPVTWSKRIHRFAGNVLLADGSVHCVNRDELRELLRTTGDPTNRIALP